MLLNQPKSTKGGMERNGLIGELEKRWTQVVRVKCELYGDLHWALPLSALNPGSNLRTPAVWPVRCSAWGCRRRRLSTLAQLWLGASLGELFGKARLRQEIVGRC
jgi:hypothetical protein